MESLFPEDQIGNPSGPENLHYELGTVFRSSVPGTITHLRVFALPSETGEHTARLWRNDNNSLVSGPHSWDYHGGSGWLTLDIPDAAITPDTTYTVTVSTGATNSSGNRPYPFRAGELAVAGGNGINLTYPANAGVFSTTVGARPVNSFNGANYYRDIVFQTAPPEPPSESPVRINEFVAQNTRGLRDEDGDTSDWIELYNPKATAVNVTGYQLADGTETWSLPPAIIPPQGFLVIFASGKNRLSGTLHANFKLEQTGETLALKDAAGTVLSEFIPAFPNQRSDVAWGRGSNGLTGFIPVPTPGNFNTAAVEGFVSDTVFSVRRGIFTEPVSVVLSTATPGAEIRYTLDGTTPSAVSPLYTSALELHATTTLRARAFRNGWVPTNTDSNTYLFPASVILQTAATAQASGWPAGPVNGQVLRYGTDSPTASSYPAGQKIAALTQIASISVVTDQANLTGAAEGVYVNATVPGLERPASVELIPPDGSAGFQIDCGMRQRGGQSRGDSFPKKSFNFFFRSVYGQGKLAFPLFGNEGAWEFDSISLRCEHGYAYADPFSLHYRLDFTGLRDVFNRDLRAACGYQTTRSRPYHLYLNGQYWGLYETQERAQEDFGESYFGGVAEEYDGIASTGLPQRETEVTAGTIDAWQALWTGARAVNAAPAAANYFSLLGRREDGVPDSSLPVLLDPRELASYMLLHYYTGHADAPLSVSFNYERPNNFRCLRRRGLTDPWHFFVHDAESSTRALEWDADRVNNNGALLTSPNRNNILYSNPEWIHEDLLASPEYRIAFADEAQRLLLNDGPFTASRALALWNARAGAISEAVVGESIRWAQSSQENQSAWNAEVNDVRNNFFPGRSATVIGQLRTRGIFPPVDAPFFSPRGGRMSPGASVALTAGAGGTIYYTTDGRDPRAIGGLPAGTVYTGTIAVATPLTIRARFLSAAGVWSAEDHASFSVYPSASSASLVLTKIHYNPLSPTPLELSAGFNDGNDFEYLEFLNRSNETIDLSGVQVTGGVSFAFSESQITVLAPGDRVIVAENTNAFAGRYGAGLPVAGTFTGNLSNSGETLRVLDSGGSELLTVTYDDVSPWPSGPDGDGPALVLRSGYPDVSLAGSWRASYATGGKPGEDDRLTVAEWRTRYFSAADLSDPAREATVWGDAANPDADESSNLLEYALGSSPVEAGRTTLSQTTLQEQDGSSVLEVTFRVREGAAGITLHPEMSTDLDPSSWQPLLSSEYQSQNDGTALLTVRQPLPSAGRYFIRLRVTAP